MIAGLSFAAFDIETANPSWGSICSIGVATVRDGRLVSARSWLCRPPSALDHFAERNVQIHGIRPGMVSDAPAFAQRLPEVLREVGDLPVVAHNAKFDMGNVHRACGYSGVTTPDWRFGCSCEWSRRQLSTLANHKLKTVTRALGVELKSHHEAAADAAAAAEITIKLADLSGARNLTELARATGTRLGRMTHAGVVSCR
ncbi:DNA polymerase III subunit epsilon [Nocardia tengchongensis]|uniref:DNA polymerase III subunit epsilon n=1 Tax=Nocardia tengchongensis TaxID=2055889 RepID=A0ABX8CWJ7_9NOCA|nr:exonuclease domain-containing protein [Nocardia tengchongensis]QVI24277.1 DNA polymerase III subunit epsilon [Nocardia tengchongensis]